MSELNESEGRDDNIQECPPHEYNVSPEQAVEWIQAHAHYGHYSKQCEASYRLLKHKLHLYNEDLQQQTNEKYSKQDCRYL